MPNAAPVEAIWDWELIKALYWGGMELSEIVQVPKFRNLSINYLRKRASEQRWKFNREAARAEGTGQIAVALQERMANAIEIHQDWLLNKMTAERNIFDRTKNEKGGDAQMERLQIIDKIDTVVRRQLGLDDAKPLDDKQRNLGILLHIQHGGAVIGNGKGASAITITVGTALPPEKMAVAKEILTEHIEAKQEGREPNHPPPPGFTVPKPPRFKPDSLVDEKSGTEDLVDTLRGAGYDARVISEGKPNELDSATH